MKTILAVVLMAGCAAAQGQSKGVPSEAMSAYDVGALRQGDYAEYEFNFDGKQSIWRIACVRVDAEFVEIESRSWKVKTPEEIKKEKELAAKRQKDKPSPEKNASLQSDEEPTIVYTVGIGDRIVRKANLIVDGTLGKDMKVNPGRAEVPQYDLPIEATLTMQDNQRAFDKVFACDKTELRTKVGDQLDVNARVMLWTSPKAPFPYLKVDKSEWFLGRDVTWTGKEPKSGGLVRVELQGWPAREFRTKDNVAKLMIKLVKSGKDAKSSVR